MNFFSSDIYPLLLTRAGVYELLRGVFIQEPSPDFLRLLTEEFVESFPFQEENEGIQAGIRELKAYLQAHNLETDEEYESLHWDYTRMFIGPEQLPAPLWESAYLNKDRLLFQQETLAVRQAYLAYQFLPKHFLQEADDHLGLELDFIYQLSTACLDAWKAEDTLQLTKLLQDQRSFLKDHLLRWVPELTSNICASAELGFYPAMAKILNGYLTLDLEALEELIDIVSIGS